MARAKNVLAPSSSSSSSCETANAKHKRFVSPVTDMANRLLWGRRQHDGAYGVVFRVPDIFDTSRSDHAYVPVSYCHASMRAPKPVYKHVHIRGESQRYASGLLLASKYQANWALRELQQEYQHHDRDDNTVVEVVTMFAGDCDSVARGSTKVGSNGRGCNREWTLINVNGTTPYLPGENCRCDKRAVPPERFGEFQVAIADMLGKGHRIKFALECAHDGVDVKDLVRASNSKWRTRAGWNNLRNLPPNNFRGHTECMATGNVRDPRAMDAIVIKLPVLDRLGSRNRSLQCNNTVETKTNRKKTRVNEWSLEYIQREIEGIQKTYYSSPTPPPHLPVIFMEETKGMDTDECHLHWEGTDCDEGYRKEFFSHEWQFQDGGCLAVPPGCQDPYYFPVDATTGKCSVHSLTEPFSCRSFDREVAALMSVKGRVIIPLLPASAISPISRARPEPVRTPTVVVTSAEEYDQEGINVVRCVIVSVFLFALGSAARILSGNCKRKVKSGKETTTTKMTTKQTIHCKTAQRLARSCNSLAIFPLAIIVALTGLTLSMDLPSQLMSPNTYEIVAPRAENDTPLAMTRSTNSLTHDRSLWQSIQHKAMYSRKETNNTKASSTIRAVTIAFTTGVHEHIIHECNMANKNGTSSSNKDNEEDEDAMGGASMSSTVYDACYPGAPRLASFFDTVRRAAAASDEVAVVLDIGDAAFGLKKHNESAVAVTMDRLGYDAMTIGNHDLDIGVSRMSAFASSARFRILASNVEGELPFVRDFDRIDIRQAGDAVDADAYLCVIGVTTSDSNPSAGPHLRLLDPVSSVIGTAIHLSNNGAGGVSACERTIVLSHAGIHVDRQIARAAVANGVSIDAIIGGYQHVSTGVNAGRLDVQDRPELAEFDTVIDAPVSADASSASASSSTMLSSRVLLRGVDGGEHKDGSDLVDKERKSFTSVEGTSTSFSVNAVDDNDNDDDTLGLPPIIHAGAHGRYAGLVRLQWPAGRTTSSSSSSLQAGVGVVIESELVMLDDRST